ncbi:hypothetical protein AQJ66_21135 [Streptomyces bungoensis]|uniref:Peptidoglycan binding domain-containing protein n=1 Tax=Streptomyces bungoensis TaxID=285568 RepID=A0A101SZ36_9ACTN|nr:hypothetical protein [Streptomyces bungoensis]KUN82812.1 hypothetical protein AQJ66_21135 [Streptomyces bungoensis]
MSRETDTPSSGPNGRGGAAYPSGTPPYGTPMASDAGADAGRSAKRPEERKTETTLTTRIRINIPGSRPIPPVVMRTPVGDGEAAVDDADTGTRPAPAPAAPAGAAEPPAEPAPQAEDKPASDWFAPRKSAPPKGGPAGGGTNGAGTPAGSAPAPAAAGPAGTRPGAPGASGAAGTTGARPGGGRPGGVVGSMGVPGGARPGATNGKGLPGATGGPVAPGHGGGTGSFDVTEVLAAGALGGSRPGPSDGGEPSRDDLPYFAENGGQSAFGAGNGPAGANGASGTNGANSANGANGHGGFNGPGGPGGRGPQGPAGPTSGPVTGDGPLLPQGPRSALSDLDGTVGESFDAPGGYGDTGSHQLPGGYGDTGSHRLPGAGNGQVRPPAPGGGLSDDTAILTPQKPAPEPGTPGYRAPDNVSGHTVTSGIPVVPSAGTAPFGPGGAAGGDTVPRTAPRPEPAARPKAAAKPAKKGRSKLMLLGVGVFVLAGGAYGAGLLMSHSDVPKGTTVLGVDIGGGTRDDAVKKLDDAFGSRVNKPLKLSVGGQAVSVTPDKAGLQFDFQATVSQAAKSDYNPVSVIGSLFGQKREIEPVMPVDEEKLQAALQQTGGGSGSVTEGGITFKSGKAVAVYGKAGKAIDAARSTQAVEQAYRTLVETGTATPVTVPATTKQPTVSNAEVDREMKAFAEPAMSARVTVQTDAAHSIPMSPQNSLWKFLRVTAVDGKLVDKPDLTALKALYGKTFDGVLVTRANGKKTPVTPEDVYGALRQALVSRTNRVAVIDTNPS